ncbi:MAG: hypothetical protein M1426_02020, partial [Patescibacteria group bacterium]|nr:hypothetical protein [Patescibacteria group bacterium]
MPDQFVENIKAHFSEGSIPDSEIIRNILAPINEKLQRALTTDQLLDSEQKRIIIYETIRLLFEKETERARAVSKKLNLSSTDFLELAEIAFDVAILEHKPENAFHLVTNFIMDARRTSQGILTYMEELIGQSKFEQAAALKKEYKEKLRKPDISQIGKILFEKAMTFNPAEERRNYQKAFIIREVFEVEEKVTVQHALIQYEYNINHKFYNEAIDVARMFNLPKSKIFNAIEKVVTEKFDEFKNLLFMGKYKSGIALKDNDPYKQTLFFTTKYRLFERETARDKEPEKIRNEIQKSAYCIIKRLTEYDELDVIDPVMKVYFTGTIISDFKLLTTENEKVREECKQMATAVINQMKDSIDSPDSAMNSYSVLFELYQEMPGSRDAIQDIASRMFEIFMEHNRPKMIEQTIKDFELGIDYLFPPLKKKALALLEGNNFEEFQQFVKQFSIIEKLKSDNDFMQRAFYFYERLIFAASYQEALSFKKLFKFAQQRDTIPLKLILKDLLAKEKWDEAQKLISMFSIKNYHIMDVAEI